MKKRLIGRHIVVDSQIRDGEPVFRGTRITVREVLGRVADGADRESIIREYRGEITPEAIAEAVRTAGSVFTERARVPAKDELDALPTILGEYIVADPAICHGTVTFRGTRLFVADILNDVANDRPWDEIIRRWHDSITPAAIAEAVRVAARFLSDHVEEYALEPTSA